MHSGSANKCMSGYNNTTVNADVYLAASSQNTTNLTAYYGTMTQLMYDNYTDIWLVVPAAFSVTSAHLHGIVSNPMGSAEPYALLFNTQWAS